MTILADSNVFIDLWRKAPPDIIDVFRAHTIVICGAIKSELLQGARSPQQLLKIETELDKFDELDFTSYDWTEYGKQLYLLRVSGITVPTIDSIIAYIAIKYDIPVWTQDKHFNLMQSVLTDLHLFMPILKGR